MANVQVTLTQPWACFCDTNSSAGLVQGPETAEYNNSIYIYTEAAEPADAIQDMIDAGRTPNNESFERMKEQVLSTAGTNGPDQTLLDQVAAIEAIQADPRPRQNI